MASVTMKDLAERVNIDAVVEEARAAWQKRESKRRGLTTWLIRFTPIGMLVMSFVFYSLSAPHTAGIVNIITPGWGMFAPLALELGIIILSIVLNSGHKSVSTKALMWTIVFLSMFINIAGGFIAVVEQAKAFLPVTMQIEGETFQSLIGRYNALPAIFQIVLLVVIPIGALIPLFAKVTGEFLIKMAIGRIKLETESDEMKWVKERVRVVYGALFQVAIKEGAGTATAGNWAKAVAERLFREVVYEDVEAVANQPATRPQAPVMGFAGYAQARLGQDSLGQSLPSQSFESPTVSPLTNSKDLNGQSSVRLSKQEAAQWLQANPQHAHRHPRALCKLYMFEKYGYENDSGYKSFERAKKELSQ